MWFYVDDLFIPKPDKDNEILLPSDPYELDSYDVKADEYEFPVTIFSEKKSMDTCSAIDVEAVDVSYEEDEIMDSELEDLCKYEVESEVED